MRNKLTLNQIAEIFGVHLETVRRWVRSGSLKAHREVGKGKSLFVEADELERFRSEVEKTA
ncbi:MAG TPA: helix-turn-helix domain-containing protein [Clostridia bacterium]|nr:helix-turn-helix domain-containing protein [Clostridia bacterium]